MTQSPKDATVTASPVSSSSSSASSSSAPSSASSGVGTSMLRSLSGGGYDVQMKALAPRPDANHAIQKKAVIGSSYTPPADVTDAKQKAVVADDKVRRFKTRAEFDNYAATEKADNAGMLPKDGTWLRLDELHVLGEDHNTPLAPDILKATGTRKYRYEGFARHDPQARKNSGALDAHLKGPEDNKVRKNGGDPGAKDEPSHDAEDAAPRYARAVPDVQQIIDAQKANKAIDGGNVTPRAAWDPHNKKMKTVIEVFVTALLYLQSFDKRDGGHELKTFYGKHKAAVDAAILALDGAAMATVPDLAGLAISGKIADVTKAFETVARAELGLTKPEALTAFKGKLEKGVKPEAVSAAGQENDFLRDASMLNMIKQAKAGDDKLFVIGDAHRKKLQGEIEGLGVPCMRDEGYIDAQKQLNKDVGLGVTGDDRATMKATQQKIEAAKASYAPSKLPQRHGDKFELKALADLPNCTWQVSGAQLVGVGQYEAYAETVDIAIVWALKGAKSVLFRREYRVLVTNKQKDKVPPKFVPKPPAPTSSGGAPTSSAGAPTSAKGEPDGKPPKPSTTAGGAATPGGPPPTGAT